jgi:hypothetical protein
MAEPSGNRKVGWSTTQPSDPSAYPTGSPPSMPTPSASKPKRSRARSVTHSPGAVPITSVAGSRETS